MNAWAYSLCVFPIVRVADSYRAEKKGRFLEERGGKRRKIPFAPAYNSLQKVLQDSLTQGDIRAMKSRTKQESFVRRMIKMVLPEGLEPSTQ